MKNVKCLLVAGLILFVGNTSAESRRQKVGIFGTEVQFTPFGHDDDDYSLNSLKFRYFMTDKDALRLKIGFGVESLKYEDDELGGNLEKGRLGDLSVDLGYERHFKVAKRLSLYAGVQVGVYKHFASAKVEYTEDLGNGSHTYQVVYKNCVPTSEGNVGERAHVGVAASVFTGLDFYVYKGLYLGTEVGIYVMSTKTNQTELKYSDKVIKGTDTYRAVICNAIKPMVRLGWTF